MLTFLGLDNFAVAAGWVGMDFACVGEWFLGSILFLYLLFPFLQRALRKNAWLTWAVTLAVCVPVHLLGWDARLVAVHIPEFLFGMTFLMQPKKAQYILAPALLVAAILAKGWDGKITCALASMGGVYPAGAGVDAAGPPLASCARRRACQNFLRGVPCASCAHPGYGIPL